MSNIAQNDRETTHFALSRRFEMLCSTLNPVRQKVTLDKRQSIIKTSNTTKEEKV